MRPLDDRDRRKSAGVARARVCLKTHLEWLDGFPVSQSRGQLQWMLRPRIGLREGRAITIDRDTLRRATMAVTRLTTQLASSTEAIVGDVTAWQDQVSTLLESLKAIIHQDHNRLTEIPFECLCQKEIQTVTLLTRQFPELHGILKAMIWSHWTSPAKRASTLSWVSNNAEQLAAYLKSSGGQSSEFALLLFADLVQTDAGRDLAVLQQMLLDAQSFDVARAHYRHEVFDFTRALKLWRDPESAPKIPVLSESDFPARVLNFLHWLTDEKPRQRQLALRMLALVVNFPALRKWRESWLQFDHLVRATFGSLQTLVAHLSRPDFHVEACRMAEELRESLSACGPVVVTADLLEAIRALLDTRSIPFCEALCDFVAIVPQVTENGLLSEDGCLLRMALVREASQHPDDGQPGRNWIRYHHLAAKFLQDNRQSNRALVLWNGLIEAQRRDGYLHSPVRAVVFNFLDDTKRWPEYFKCLSVLKDHKQFSDDCYDVIAWLLNQSTGVAEACDRFSQIAELPWLHDCSGTQIISALQLVTNGFPFAELLTLIGPESRMQSERLDGVVILHQYFVQAGWPDVVPSVLRSLRIAEVTQLSLLLGISTAFPERPVVTPRPANPIPPTWAVALPSELLPSIACFCALHGANPKKAQSIVARHFPAADDLRTEIEALERLVAQHPEDAHRSERLQNLKRRLTNPDRVSVDAIRRLCRKLEDTTMRHVFRSFRDRVLSSIEQFLHARIGGCRIGRELSEPRQLELVSSLLRLHEPFREFGLRLLRKCWGGDDWDPAGESANVRFLQSLEVRGIRVAPWLRPRSVRVSVEGRRHPLVLSFASSEVEIMLMGHYFGTCLSPDGPNFFSAVANAVDVNKRVVFLRTVSGDVVGRCLLALGESGTLMTYNPYCNDESFPMAEHMARFAETLATEMGTVVSHSDTVAKLLAPDWYDDGAHDLGNSILSETSPLRIAIRAASEDNILLVVELALGSVGLSDTMLELIVELAEFAARPVLIRPFIAFFERSESQLGVSSLIKAGLLAFEAGESTFANRVLLKHGPAWIMRQQPDDGFSDAAVQLLRALINIHPSKALRILRETRYRTIRSDVDEFDETRRELLADCFKALARPRLAAALRK